MSEFNNLNPHANLNIKTLDGDPKNPLTAGSSSESTPTTETEHTSFWTKTRIGGAIVLAAILGGGGTATAVALNHAPEADPKANSNINPDGGTPGSVTEPVATPSAEQTAPAPEKTTSPVTIEDADGTPRIKGGDFERTDPLPESLQAAESATPEEFLKLPKKTQIQWATWAGQYKDQFIATYSQMEESEGPYKLTTESDTKTLLLDRNYNERLGANFGLGGVASENLYNGKLDVDTTTKYMYAFTVNDEKSDAAVDNYVSSILEVNNGEAANVWYQAGGTNYDSLKDIKTSQDFTETSTVMVIDGKNVQAKLVSWTSQTGAHFNFKIAAYETVDYKGEPIVVTIAEQA